MFYFAIYCIKLCCLAYDYIVTVLCKKHFITSP